MNMKLLLAFALIQITGCDYIPKRYSNHPFGEETTYNIIYTEASAETLYTCIFHKVSELGYQLELGWPTRGKMDNYFVNHKNEHFARYDFADQHFGVINTSVAVMTPGGNSSMVFVKILEECDAINS